MTKSIRRLVFRSFTVVTTLAALWSGVIPYVAWAASTQAPAPRQFADETLPTETATTASAAATETLTPSPTTALTPTATDVITTPTATATSTTAPTGTVDMSVALSYDCSSEYNVAMATITIDVTGGAVSVDDLAATLEGTRGGSTTYTPADRRVGTTLAPGSYEVRVRFGGFTITDTTLRVSASGTFSGQDHTASATFDLAQCTPPTPSATTATPSPTVTTTATATATTVTTDTPTATTPTASSPTTMPPTTAPTDSSQTETPTAPTSSTTVPDEEDETPPTATDQPAAVVPPAAPMETPSPTTPTALPSAPELPGVPATEQPEQPETGTIPSQTTPPALSQPVVAGMSDETSAQPAMLPETGRNSTPAWPWLMLALGLLLAGVGLRTRHIRRN